ncbi:hypothetical protein [Occallatibacter riparius]|uniref:DUF1440 domain-containing protein n=1 Tax=Occallatibacter riparius TaxID=1002689 RepID=A0A9J7BIU7_9BACT|nr:hypothetical protein [Occallatibacter riparius]UWZ82427.1 hypothetical protein MOP44_17840 [Occallatibacter riparius]
MRFRTLKKRHEYMGQVELAASTPRGLMNMQNANASVCGSRALMAIGIAGGIAGTLDLTQASILFGLDVPRVIAAGLLGKAAVHGGTGMWILGVCLHYFIAISAAGMFYAASRRWTFMTEYPLVCGLLFGGVVEEVMNLIVLPLSALHARGPYELSDLLQGLGVHAVVFGLPVAYCIRHWAPAAPRVAKESEQATIV